MESTSHGLKSSVEQSRGGDEARNSDSGDSIFLTQEPTPEAPPRPGSSWTRGGPAGLMEDIHSSSSSGGVSRRRRKRRRLKVPACRFSFLTERKGQTKRLRRMKIKKLYSYMMGGYMNYVRELWESYERGVDLAASLPTVDADGEEISPASEEEETDGAVEDEDIRVVERKDFATSAKARSSRPWCALRTRSSEERKPRRDLNASPGRQQQAVPHVSTPEPKETASSTVQTSGDEDDLCGRLKEMEAQGTCDTKTGRHPDDEGCLSPSEDIDVNEVPKSTQKKKKKKKAAAEDNDGSVEEHSAVSGNAETDLKKKTKNADVDGRTDPAAKPPTDEVSLKRKKDPNVTSGLSQSPTEHHSENTDAPQETELSVTKRRKHKKKKKKKNSGSAGEDVDFSNDAETNTDSTSQKKKMADISHSAEEDERDVNKRTEEQDPELRTGKKKRQNNQSVSPCEDTAAPVNYSGSVQKKKKKKKRTSSFLAADEEENGAEEQPEPSQSAARKPHVSAADLAAKSAENAQSLEELKDGVKKKRSAVQEEGETGFEEPKGTPSVEVEKKRKCKRSDGKLTESWEESQTDAAVPPKKKKKKKKEQIPPAATRDADSDASTLGFFSSDSQEKKSKKERGNKKLSPAKKSSPEAAEPEARKTKQTKRTETDFHSGSKTSSPSVKQKNSKKRKLYDPNRDFLSDV